MNLKIKIILINISLTLSGLLLIGFILEYQFQSDRKNFETSWPAKHYRGIGWHFEPGKKVKWTNHSSYWQETTANELGFLDRPGVNKRHASGLCNVAFLGDSFVEAAQIPIEKKAHVVLERLAEESSALKKLRTSAFAYSGTGQVTQKPFFDNYIIPLKPDILVMVVVSNDISDNSPILTSIRNGWHPAFSPRPFYKRDDNNQLKYHLDHPEWAANLLREPNSSFIKNLAIWKRFGVNFTSKHNITDPIIESRVEKILNFGLGDHITDGIEEIKTHLDIDHRFRHQPVDLEAVAITKHVFNYYQRISEEMGTKIIIVYNYEIIGDKSNKIILNQANQRRQIFSEIGNDLKIPIIFMDDGELISLKKIGQVLLKNDGHWSIHGHSEVAEKVLSFILRNKEFCQHRNM